MRRNIAISILAGGVALAVTAAYANDQWFRMSLDSGIYFGVNDGETPPGGGNENPPGGGNENPPGHGGNSGDQPVIHAVGGTYRALTPIVIDVEVDSGSGMYQLFDDHDRLDVHALETDGLFELRGDLLTSASVELTATDMLSTPAEPVSIDLNILEPFLVSGPASVGAVRVGSPVDFDFVANGSSGSVDWELFGAPGLSISGGHVSGTPSVGTHSITAKATDAWDDASDTSDPVSLVVHPDLTVAMANINATNGQTLAANPTFTGRAGTLSWAWAPTSAARPSGMQLNLSTGQVYGTASTSATGLILRATDSFDGLAKNTGAFSITVTADTTPDAFTIAAASNVEPRWMATSSSVTPVGYSQAVPISVSAGAEIQINNGSWVTNGTISPGQSFRVRKTSPDQGLSDNATSVTVGNAAAVQWPISSWSEVVRTITASTTAANISTTFGSDWTGSARKRLIINSGVVVSSTSSGTPALNVPANFGGSVIIENKGVIAGAGGTGGSANGGAGGQGGTALSLATTGIKVINTGTIAGGGGGGGGGAKGADIPYSNSTRDPSSGWAYSKSNAHYRIDLNKSGQSTYNFINYMGVTNGLAPGTTAPTSQGAGNCTYFRGGLKDTSTFSDGTSTKYYEIYRTCTTSGTNPGGNGGAGGAGAAYPSTSGASGSAGTSNGGTGGNGGGYGAYGVSAGGSRGAPGYAISGTPAGDSVLGSKFGL